MISLIETPFGRFYAPEGDLITDQLRRLGAHQRNELAMLRDLLRPGDVVVDVGGHIGTFAIPIAQRVGPTGHVYAVEGHPDTFRLLEKNVAENGLGDVVSTHHCLLSSGERRFYEPTIPDGNTGATFFRRVESGGEGRIESKSLDDLLAEERRSEDEEVALLKIDTEGMELEVLRGCRALLERRPMLYFEWSPLHLVRQHGSGAPRELEELLESLGYHVFMNLGRRNSSSDHYAIGRFASLRHCPGFGDILAVHPDSPRYPRRAQPPAVSFVAKRFVHAGTVAVSRLRKVRRQKYLRGAQRQDKWLNDHLFKDRREGYFVELGAHDGVTNSNTFFFEKALAWNGLLIEPNERLYARIEEHRAATRLNACVYDGSEVEFVDRAGHSGIVSEGMDNAGPADVAGQRSRVKTITIAEALRRAGAPAVIDYFSLDVEGAEQKIIETFPFDSHRVVAFTIERASAETDRVLAGHGYVLVRQEWPDHFYVKRRAAEEAGLEPVAFREFPVRRMPDGTIQPPVATMLRDKLRRRWVRTLARYQL